MALIDINPGRVYSDISCLTVVDDGLCFSANDDVSAVLANVAE